MGAADRSPWRGGFAFLITSAILPLASAAIEEWMLEPVEGEAGKAKLIYTVSVDFRWFVWSLKLILKWQYGRMFRSAVRNLTQTVLEDKKLEAAARNGKAVYN